MRQDYINSYINLIEGFLEKKINTKIFERDFLDLFNENADDLDSDLYDVVEYLFYKVEAYTDIPSLLKKDPASCVNEDQLREGAAKTFQDLRNLK